MCEPNEMMTPEQTSTLMGWTNAHHKAVIVLGACLSVRFGCEITGELEYAEDDFDATATFYLSPEAFEAIDTTVLRDYILQCQVTPAGDNFFETVRVTWHMG